MKGILIKHENEHFFSKEEAYKIVNANKAIISCDSLGEFIQELLKDVWVITNQIDHFGNGTFGCINYATGEWRYIKPEDFENLDMAIIPN